MFAFVEHFEHAPGQPELALAWLVGVGIDAERDRFGQVRRLGQFAPQQIGRVDLGEQAGFEIKPRRQPEVAVRGPREAVDAAKRYVD
jgi:hypothetical protein